MDAAYFHQYYLDHKQEYKDRSAKWYEKNGKKRYGLTRAERQELLKQPCAICGDKAEAVDHDHDSGKVRGVLCHPCNLGLGKFKDSTESLSKAIEYLSGSEVNG